MIRISILSLSSGPILVSTLDCARGRLLPNPLGTIRIPSIPWDFKYSITANPRFHDNLRFFSALPRLLVCPSISTTILGFSAKNQLL